MKRFFFACCALTLAILALCMVMVGVLFIFGSFFFEVTRSQLTWMIVFQHLGIFFVGVASVVGGLFSLPLVFRVAELGCNKTTSDEWRKLIRQTARK